MSTRNITKAYRLASDDDVTFGLSWYAGARALAESLDPENPSRAAGVIASMSPMNSWPNNLRLAKDVYEGDPFTFGNVPMTLGANSAKAVRIQNGAAPLDVLSGPKTRSFYLNIMGIDSDEAITIDRHAMDAAFGKVQTDKERAPMVGRKGGYDAIVREYARAAAILSKEAGTRLTGAQVQAVVWVYWRHNKIKNFHGDGHNGAV